MPRGQRARAALLKVQAAMEGKRGDISTAAVQAPERTATAVDRDSPARSPVPAATSQPKGRVVLESEEELRSTWEHRAWVGTANLLLATLAYQGLAGIEGPGDAAAVALAFAGAYVFSDLGTGIFHWAVDNYGNSKTPVAGGVIASFQGHHQRPWTITEREFCNNVHMVFKPAVPFAAGLLVLSAWTPGWFDFGIAWFVWFVCMSQQFHAWSHMKRSELPGAVTTLQDAGLLISRKAHGAHHKAPFEGNYCIVSGLWNEALDQSGAEDAFFRRLEKGVHAATGAEPRCWNEPNYAWVDHYFADGTNDE